MNKNFTQLKTNIGNRVQDTSSSLATLIGYWVNDKYRDVVSRYEWDELYYPHTINASASTSAYALPTDADRVIICLDSTNDENISEVTNQQFYLENYDTWNSTGTPDKYFLTYDVVKSQPASAEQITIKSSSSSDTTQTLILREIVNGDEIYESLTLDGVNAVTASNSLTRIVGISKSAATAGYVTLYSNDETTVLGVLPTEQLEGSYRILNLHPVPTGAITYKLIIKRRVLPLGQDYDYPVVKDLADVIEYGATAEAWRYKKQFSKAQAMDVMYEKLLSEKIYQREAQPNRINQFVPTALSRNDGLL